MIEVIAAVGLARSNLEPSGHLKTLLPSAARLRLIERRMESIFFAVEKPGHILLMSRAG